MSPAPPSYCGNVAVRFYRARPLQGVKGSAFSSLHQQISDQQTSPSLLWAWLPCYFFAEELEATASLPPSRRRWRCIHSFPRLTWLLCPILCMAFDLSSLASLLNFLPFLSPGLQTQVLYFLFCFVYLPHSLLPLDINGLDIVPLTG